MSGPEVITHHEPEEVDRILDLIKVGTEVILPFGGDPDKMKGRVTRIVEEPGPSRMLVEYDYLSAIGGSAAYPYYGGEWWVIPEEEWFRWTRKRKSESETDEARASDISPNERYHLLKTVREGSRLLTTSGGCRASFGSDAMAQAALGLEVVVDKILERSDTNLRVTVKSPLCRMGRSSTTCPDGVWLYNTIGSWRLKPVAEETDTTESETESGSREGTEMAENPNPESVPEVVRSGKAIALPDGMSIDKAITTLQRRKKYEEEETQISEEISTFPWDGAHALSIALMRRYGWATAEPTPGFFGPTPPALIAVEVAPGKTINVPWGRFSIPGIEGFIQTAAQMKDGKPVFILVAVVRRKHEKEIKELAETVRTIAREESIYRAKAIKVSFADEKKVGEFPMPKFLDVTKATEDRLIFSDEVDRAIRDNLYTPIERYSELARLQVPFKRGVLFAGTYGTGKTELAFTAALKATEAGITFVYCEDAKDFPKAIQFALQYAPAVVFTEDIDRVTGGDRTRELDIVLNTIDGIEAKTGEIFVVLTTNAVENINKAMIRPGRIDAVIEVKRPDPKAVDGLIRLYARDLLPEGENVGEAAKLLAGQIPAVIREVVERAKLSALRLAAKGSKNVRLSGPALASSAETMRMQLELLNRKDIPSPSDFEKMGHVIGGYITEGLDFAKRVRAGELVEACESCGSENVEPVVNDEEFNRALGDAQKKRDAMAIVRPRGGKK